MVLSVSPFDSDLFRLSWLSLPDRAAALRCWGESSDFQHLPGYRQLCMYNEVGWQATYINQSLQVHPSLGNSPSIPLGREISQILQKERHAPQTPPDTVTPYANVCNWKNRQPELPTPRLWSENEEIRARCYGQDGQTQRHGHDQGRLSSLKHKKGPRGTAR